MSVDVTVETEIARPAAEVASYATDCSNDAVWIGGISEANMLTNPPLGVGTHVARVAHFLGKRIEYVNEVERYEPGALMEMRSIKGPFPMRITYTFDAADGGTLARIRVRGDAHGFYRMAGPLLSTMVRRSIGKDIANLKTVLEQCDG